MRTSLLAAACLALTMASLGAVASPDETTKRPSAEADLTQTVTALDADFFGSFNRCDVPGEIERHAAFLDANLEFYHDNGGVSWTRKDYVEKTRQNVCGHFRRVLTPGSLKVYPLKDFGAIEEGDQSFCDLKTEKCFGAARFMFVWRKTDNGWVITRAFSYGHHAL